MADSITGGSKPQIGDCWRLNLYRIERSGGRQLKAQIDALSRQLAPLQEKIEANKAGKKETDEAARLSARLEPLQKHFDSQTEYTAWSETYQRGFHHPARFGVVQFAK